MNAERALGDYIDVVERISEADFDRRWQIVTTRRRRRTSRSLLRIALAGAGLASALAVWTSARHPIPEASETGLVLQTRNESRTLRLTDGSSIGLDPDTEVTLAKATNDQQSLEIVRGTVHIAVEHGTSLRRFRVRAGDVDVTDIGTVFTVARDRSTSIVRVSVAEGEVEVTSAGRSARVLHAGESLTTFDKAVAHTAALRTMAVASPRESNGASTAEPNPIELRAPSPSEPSPGEPPSPTNAPTAKSLFGEAMIAREAGNAAAAAQALDALRKRFPADARTPLATFELGRIRMDRLGDRAGALEALRSALASAPNAAFSEDAEARVIELLDAMGRASECRRLRAAFRARHPRSIHEAALIGLCPDLR